MLALEMNFAIKTNSSLLVLPVQVKSQAPAHYKKNSLLINCRQANL
jgi:hypothetical protein